MLRFPPSANLSTHVRNEKDRRADCAGDDVVQGIMAPSTLCRGLVDVVMMLRNFSMDWCRNGLTGPSKPRERTSSIAAPHSRQAGSRYPPRRRLIRWCWGRIYNRSDGSGFHTVARPAEFGPTTDWPAMGSSGLDSFLLLSQFNKCPLLPQGQRRHLQLAALSAKTGF